MNCENVIPRYYKDKEGNEGLAITEYKEQGSWDEIRAFVVMKFPYNDQDVEQAFYRSSGHNSADSFGKEFTDAEARGTWLPFNAIVVEVKNKEEKSKKLNSQLILKPPFYIPGKGILSRFHNDLELAKVSYLMGGGIWNTKSGKSLFADTELEPGCVELSTDLIHATTFEVNYYIGTAVSWNWHPVDIIKFRRHNSPKFSLAKSDFYTELDNRTFISEYLFFPPTLINYLTRNPPIPIKASDQNGLVRFHKDISWADPVELFRKEVDEEATKKRQKRGYGKRISKKRKSRKRKSKSRRRSHKRRSRKRQRKSKRNFRK